jgi:hypothetical protein
MVDPTGIFNTFIVDNKTLMQHDLQLKEKGEFTKRHLIKISYDFCNVKIKLTIK